MPHKNNLLNLLELKKQIFIKVNRESVIQQIFSDEGKVSSFSKTEIKRFEDLAGDSLLSCRD